MVFVKKMLLVFAFYDYWSLPSAASVMLQFFGQKRLDSVKNDFFFHSDFHFRNIFLPFFPSLLYDKKRKSFSRAAKAVGKRKQKRKRKNNSHLSCFICVFFARNPICTPFSFCCIL